APASAQTPVAPRSESSSAANTVADGAANDTAGAANCHKGLLWPFVRGSSDCPTADDKKIGRSTYDATAIAPAVVNASMETTVPAASANSGAPTASGGAPAGEAGCHKGLLWPFVHSAGDCPTDDEKTRS